MDADVQRWMLLLGKTYSPSFGLLYLLSFCQQFRNLFYHRINSNSILLNVLCPRMSTLTIDTKDIGEGLYLPHGYSTTIGAKSIGKNCSINNNVTIGRNGEDNHPVILDNVRIHAGAVIYGNITIGNNVVIGANSTVNTDIPDNATVFPPSSRVMKWNP